MKNSIILASSSIYKQRLMQQLRLEFDCEDPNIDESPLSDELPRAMVERLSVAKATTIAQKFPGSLVIGADQVGELDGEILTKPGSYTQAEAQLSAQSGRAVNFHSGIALVQTLENQKSVIKSAVNTTEVVFRTLSKQCISNYLLAEEPYDCAGSFKAEGLGISLFKAVNSSDPSSLTGLPLIELCTLLSEMGFDIN
ncbi:MAG: Maf family protein [Porticoccaceae bacterium]